VMYGGAASLWVLSMSLILATVMCGTTGSLVNVCNGQNMTALHLAISRGCSPAIVRHLLSLGADTTLLAK